MLNLALVPYTFTKGPEHEVLIRPHGNSHSGQPYQQTMPSTLTLLKNSAEKPARAVVSDITREQGGLLGVRSAGNLPRDQKQVYNIRQQRGAPQSSKESVPSTRKGQSDVL